MLLTVMTLHREDVQPSLMEGGIAWQEIPLGYPKFLSATESKGKQR
jgi:hypothetical protein